MKKITFILIISFVFFNINANAQKKQGKQKIRALKIAYLTEKLNLTTTEAEKFWPVYNQYNEQKRELLNFEKKEIKQKIKEGYDINSITNEDAEVILKEIHLLREKKFKNKIDLDNALLKILPPNKILLLEISEHEFHRTLMRKFKEKK